VDPGVSVPPTSSRARVRTVTGDYGAVCKTDARFASAYSSPTLYWIQMKPSTASNVSATPASSFASPPGWRKFKKKLPMVLAAAALVTGVGVLGAAPASAASRASDRTMASVPPCSAVPVATEYIP
jgi:hypothetical protein